MTKVKENLAQVSTEEIQDWIDQWDNIKKKKGDLEVIVLDAPFPTVRVFVEKADLEAELKQRSSS